MSNMEKIDEFINKLNEETAEHSKRVGFYAYIMSKEMGYTTKDSKINAVAAMTHDLGKKDIDQTVLNKAGRLTEKEFEEIKKHPELGYQELNREIKIDNFFTPNQKSTILNVARYHHEKYNGKGYPHGLSGEDLPIEANMVCIVDMYDALASPRVYKKAMSDDKILSIIKDNEKEEMFNPKVAEAFNRAYPKLKVMKEHFEHCNEKICISTMEKEIDMVLNHSGMSIESTQSNVFDIGINNNNKIELPKRKFGR